MFIRRKSPLALVRDSEPIFLLASGQRCGSTLLQRLLNSHPRVLIWGEQGGYIRRFQKEFGALRRWSHTHAKQRDVYLSEGYDRFVSNMLPSVPELNDAATIHLAAIFADPARRLGKDIWGFKEVRYDLETATFLQECFPKARFIHMTRHVADCYLSMRRWELTPGAWTREWTLMGLDAWVRVNKSFAGETNRLPRLLKVRYEDMVSDTTAFLGKIADFLRLEPTDFASSVFESRLYDFGSERGKDRRPSLTLRDLTAEEVALLTREEVVAVAGAYGYEIVLPQPAT